MACLEKKNTTQKCKPWRLWRHRKTQCPFPPIPSSAIAFSSFVFVRDRRERERERERGRENKRNKPVAEDEGRSGRSEKKGSESIRSVAGRYALTNKQTLRRSLDSCFSSFCLPLCLCRYNVSLPPLPLFLSHLILISNRTQIATRARPSVSGRRTLAADCTNLFCFCFPSCALSCVEFPP